MDRSRRSFWTWGYVEDEPSQNQREAAAKDISNRFGTQVTPPPVPLLEELELRPPRLTVPSKLTEIVSTALVDRVTHTYGGHGLELLKAIKGDFSNPPDAVATPTTDDELESVMEWCDSSDYAVVPYGGGTSVVNGVNPPDSRDQVVTVNMDRLNRVLELDPISRAGRFQGGILGPDLEAYLKPHGLTLRHYPQSFPWSTVGGWVATRSGGHYATNHTHIDDFVESVNMLTPRGWFESRRLPGSGAGPSPDRLVIGSEGILGIISDCWLRLQKRPKFRATAGVLFPTWRQGTDAVREIVQTKLFPANLRILDPTEAKLSAGVQNEQTLLIIGFESADIPQGFNVGQAVAIARDLGGQVNDADILIEDGSGRETGRSGAVGAWRQAFIGVNGGVRLGLGILSDTFETAITWDQWPEFDERVRSKVRKVLDETLGPHATLSCRFTHVYPDGPAPYYTFSGVVPIGEEATCWHAIKSAANEAIVDNGGTITHHHAVGRMHKPAWEQQRPRLFGDMLRNAKKAVDPKGILNPGVLLD